MRRIYFFCTTDEPGEPWDAESGLFKESDVDLLESQSVDSGDEIFYVFAVALESEFGEGRKDRTIR